MAHIAVLVGSPVEVDKVMVLCSSRVADIAVVEDNCVDVDGDVGDVGVAVGMVADCNDLAVRRVGEGGLVAMGLPEGWNN